MKTKLNSLLMLLVCLHAVAAFVRTKRQTKSENLCCQCEKVDSACQTNDRGTVPVIPTSSISDTKFDCLLENDFDEEACNDDYNEIETRKTIRCEPGFTGVCYPLEPGITDEISIRTGLINPNPLGIATPELGNCQDEKAHAVADLSKCPACGKRDSRLYRHSQRPPTFTNEGEWPWVVMLFNSRGDYLGAGAYVDQKTVVTAAHKVRAFQSNPRGLRVRLGAWNPKAAEDVEDYMVDCLRIHPNADLDDTLANNVAVLKIGRLVANIKGPSSGTVAGAVQPRSSNSFRRYNTICLPEPNQFTGRRATAEQRCYVAAWGANLERQREIDLPLVSDSDCARRLAPTFRSKGVEGWSPQPSEICAGGEVGKDTCQGEGGAPLVCLDRETDRYVAVGLVNYGFSCNSSMPAVYTNLMDPGVNSFVKSGFRDDFC